MAAVVEEYADDGCKGEAEEEAAEQPAEGADEECGGGGQFDVKDAVDDPEGCGAGDGYRDAADEGEDGCEGGGDGLSV